jgi:hypothetical protein
MPPQFQEKTMKQTKIWIFGIAAGLLMTMGLIAALDSYLTQIQTGAPREVLQLEPVTVTAERPAPQPDALAVTQAKRPASL